MKKSPIAVNDSYSSFECLDGEHPWMKALPEGAVAYRVRELGTGEVAYFNYSLAKEMGLISPGHPQKMTKALHEQLIRTFSVQIINEYDELQKKRYDEKTIKPKHYMASRYLQLQHADKTGKTSGDGRGIWNGIVKNKGKIWDVSSRGTGVTCLSPGSVLAGKPLPTGGTQFGYGCGQAEIDELYASALQAEMMHRQGIQTERVLCIIDLGKGVGIGVRSSLNLLRPAHLFLYLKQNRKKELKAAVDYFIERQITNRKFRPRSKGTALYEELAQETGKKFAQFAACLDVDYIFAWLDWDGDNVLADAGIIDYGSVRQFGLRHDHYRYDDVDRYSTNLNEQRMKAREIVQVFCQISDYLKTGTKKSIKHFQNHPVAKLFDQEFALQRAHRILYRLGFSESQRKNILNHPQLFAEFDKAFSYFERAKVSGSLRKVPDGINHPALFDVRKLCRELPRLLIAEPKLSAIDENLFFELLLSSYAKSKDAKKRPKHSAWIKKFQASYLQLLNVGMGPKPQKNTFKTFVTRAEKLNQDSRITGNALIQIVDEILAQRKKNVPHEEVQNWIEQLIASATKDLPEFEASHSFSNGPSLLRQPEVLEKLLSLVATHRHDI